MPLEPFYGHGPRDPTYLKDFISHLVPKSFAEAMANNEVLQILVFSLFFGTAIASLRRDGAPTMDSASHGQRGSLKEKNRHA